MAAGAGHLNAYAIGILVDLSRLERLRKKIASVTTSIHGLNASFRSKGVTTTIKNIEALTVAMNKLGATSATTGGAVVTSQAKIKTAVAASGTTASVYAGSFDKYNASVLGAARGTKNAFTDMFRRVALWSAGVGLLFGVITKIRTVFKGMKDLEESMTELKKVMDDNTPWGKAQSSIIKTAKTFSIAATEVAKITTVWAQQGKTLDEVITLTTTAALGMNSANLTATQSVEFLTSATKAYNVEAKDTEKIIDGIMKVQSDFAITSASLAKGFNVAGALAAKAEVDMGSLFGMMTAIGEVTRETGSTIGNSLKTQFARLQNPATIQYLEALGVQMREIVKSTGEIRRLTPTQIFRQISQLSKSGQVSTDEVIDIALKIGGIRKFKDALILIERFGVAEEARTKFLLAYGEAQRANDLVQENLTKKTEKLETAFLDLGLALSNQGLFDGIKLLVDGTTAIVEGATRGAKTPFGEDFIKLAGFVFLAKSITGLTKVISGAAAKGTLKQAAIVTGGSSVFAGTRQQQASTGAFNASLNRSVLALQRLNKTNTLVNFELKNLAYTAGTTVPVQIRKMASDAAVAGREFQIAGGTMKNMLRNFNLSFKTFFTRLSADQSALRTRGAAGIGAVGLRGKLLGGLKGIGSMIVWFAAIEAIMAGITWWNRDTEKLNVSIKNNIDLESEATKGVLALSKSYRENVEAAGRAKISVDAYVKSLSFSSRFAQSKKIGAALAKAIQDNVVKDLQTLQTFLKGQGILDIQTLEQAQDIMIKYRNFFKYELVGGLSDGFEKLNKTTSEAISEFERIAEDGLITFTRRAASSNLKDEPVAASDTKIVSVGNREEGVFVRLFQNAFADLGENFGNEFAEKVVSKFSPSGILGIGGQEKGSANVLDGLNALKAELNKHGNIIKLTDPFTGEVTELSDFQNAVAVAMVEAAGLFKQRIGESGDPRGSEKERATIKAKLDADFLKSTQGALLVFQSQLNISQDLINTINSLDRTFIRAIGKWIDTTFGATFAMGKVEDRIWKATSKFVANMEKLRITEGVSSLTGAASNAPVERLGIFRGFLNEISTFSPIIQNNIKDLKFLKESLVSIIPDTVDPKAKSSINRFLQATGKTSEEFNQGLNKIVTDPKFTKNLDDKARKAIASTVTRIYAAEAEFAKLTEEGGVFNATLKDLWTNLLEKAREFGLDASGEAELKNLAEKLGGDIEKATKEDLALFLKIAGSAGLEPLIDEAADKIFSKSLPKFAQKIASATNKLNSVFSDLELTGNKFVDAQTKIRTNLQNQLNSLNSKSDALQQQRDLDNISEEALIVGLRQVDFERALATVTAEANSSISDQIILHKESIEAYGAVHNTLTSMFSDIATLTDTTGRAIGDALTDIAGTRLQSQMETLFDNVFKGIEADIGSAVLGRDVVELTPEQRALITTQDINTGATVSNTLALQILTTAMTNIALGKSVESPFLNEDIAAQAKINDKRQADFDAGLNIDLPPIVEPPDSASETSALNRSLGLLVGNLGGGLGGNLIADAFGKESNRVNAGVGIGSILGTLIPGGGLIAEIGGSLLGGIFGGLFGSDKDEEKNVKPIKEDIKRIADNTAQLVAIDKRLINAPAGLTLPAGSQGGAITYNITVNNTRGDAGDIAREVSRTLNSASTNFNRVNDTLA